MRILVTGGSGRLGRFVVEELDSAGHDVVSLDIRYPDNPLPGIRTIKGDAAEMEDAFGAVSYLQAEMLVHMAAWSDPGFVADSRTYSDNVSATFNLLNVCANTGIKRAIMASSAQVYGFAESSPVFAPVDESHPLRPLNAYALSKICGEQIADYFDTRCRMSVSSFRIMGARAPQDMDHEIDLLKAASPDVGRFLLWNRTDARDIARACRLALEAEKPVSGVFNITANQNALGVPSMDLLKEHCPDTEIRAKIEGSDSIMSCRKAAEAFGYEAIHR